MPLLSSNSSRFIRCNQNSIKCFSTFVADVPPKLLQTIRDETRSLDEFQEIDHNQKPAKDNLENLANLSVDFLQTQERKGCSESSSFLKSLQLHSFNPEYRGMVLKGVPNQRVPAIYFSGIIGTITGHTFWDEARGDSLKNMNLNYNKRELPFHTDFRNYGENLPDLLTILALSSDGKIKTNYVNTQNMYNALSKESQDILLQPIFMKKADPNFFFSDETEQPFSIFYKDKKGDLHLFFKTPDSHLIEAEGSHAGNKAIAELTHIMQNPHPNIINSVALKTGEMLMLKNDPHNRSGNSDSARETLVSVFYEEEEYQFLKPSHLTKITACQLKEMSELSIV